MLQIVYSSCLGVNQGQAYYLTSGSYTTTLHATLPKQIITLNLNTALNIQMTPSLPKSRSVVPSALQNIKNHVRSHHLFDRSIPLLHLIWMHDQICLHVHLFNLRLLQQIPHVRFLPLMPRHRLVQHLIKRHQQPDNISLVILSPPFYHRLILIP